MAEGKSSVRDATTIKSLGLCSLGCGGLTCSVDVKDGKIVRIKPFDLNYKNAYDPQQKNPWTISARGVDYKGAERSLITPNNLIYKKKVYSKNRILYPLKRVDWDPEGARNPQNRGKSKYERISWDEASTLVANEIRRQEEKYGLTSILAIGTGHGESHAIHGPHGCQNQLLWLLGDYTLEVRTPDSWEGWFWGANHVWNMWPVGQMRQQNFLKDIMENTTLDLVWGGDPETNSWGWCGQNGGRIDYYMDQVGIKRIYVSPDFNYTAAVHPGKWVPVLPNTDSALQLAIIYTWLDEGTYDKDYLDTHALGFDYMENYVLGKEDGIPKTPKWAEGICGTPARTIKALAREWAANNTITEHVNGGGYIRGAYSHEPGRLEVVLLAMQGLGKPGTGMLTNHNFNIFGNKGANAAPRIKFIPNVEGAYHGIDFQQMPSQFIPKTMVPVAITGDWTEDNPLTWYGTPWCTKPVADQFIPHQYPMPGCSRIHMIWTSAPSMTSSWQAGNLMEEAYCSDDIECFVVQTPWFENDCIFADIILPTNTKLEQEDLGVDFTNGNYALLYYEGQSIQPLGESKSDYEACVEIAKKLGVEEEYTKNETYEDLIHNGWAESGAAEDISYEDFRKNEYYIVPTAEDWEDDEPGLHAFYRDPENNPLQTPTGLLEIFSQSLDDYFPDDKERGPYPKYIADGETHQESLYGARGEKYPFLLMSNHPRWRFHSMLDDIPWYHEIEQGKVYYEGYPYEPVWINPIDAERKGIKNGDVVEILNDRGTVLGGAYVTERVMPGVVSQDHGANVDPLEIGKVDRGGSNNLIVPTYWTSKNCVGEVTNNFLCDIRKADMDALKQKYPEAFARKTNDGFSIEAWLVEEGE